LTRALNNDFPHVRRWLQNKDPAIFCDLLSHWPTRHAAQLARRPTLERGFRPPHGRAAAGITPRIAAIKSAVALATADGVIPPPTLLGPALVAQLRGPWHAIADFDPASAPCAQDPPDCPLVDAWPGAGAVFAPRLLVAFGEQRERYAAAEALQKYAGLAPGTERRGKTAWVPWRLQCPTFRRQTVVAWAAASTRPAFWAQVYYQQQRDQGKAHQAAVRALACKGLRRLSRGWQARPLYDEALYLQALKRRSAPLLQHLAH
jgi:hypothetical protein